MQLIDGYSRQQAIEDGVLINVTKLAVEAGIRYSVAVTQRLWHGYIVPTKDAEKLGQSVGARLWDVLYLFRMEAKRCPRESQLKYMVGFVMSPTTFERITIKAVVSAGDNREPVITLMLPSES